MKFCSIRLKSVSRTKSSRVFLLFSLAFFAVSLNVLSFSDSPLFAVEQKGIVWETDFKKAMQLAADTDRLVIIHFYGDYCPPCRKMDAEVFSRDDVAAAIEPHYVALKVDSQENPNAVKNLNITSIPSDLVATPRREIIYRRQGESSAERYTREMLHVVQKHREAQAAKNAAPPLAETSVADPSKVYPPALKVEETEIFIPNEPVPSPAVPVSPPAPTLETSTAEEIATEVATNEFQSYDFAFDGIGLESVAENQITVEASEEDPNAITGLAVPAREESEAPAEEPKIPYILDGFCPVELQDNERWVAGNEEFTLRYRNQFFVFSCTESLMKFAKNPEAYTPVAMGEDVVQMAKTGDRLKGQRGFGAWYQGKIYLFSSQENYESFAERPAYYASIATKLNSAQIGVQANEKKKTLR